MGFILFAFSSEGSVSDRCMVHSCDLIIPLDLFLLTGDFWRSILEAELRQDGFLFVGQSGAFPLLFL